MMGVFRIVALIEGVTTILLFFVAMPLKYLAGYPALIPTTGMAHGVAFIAYLLAMAPALIVSRASVVGWLRTTLAAFVPLGTFVNDGYLRRLGGQGGAAPLTRRSRRRRRSGG
ncbi:hypothetical protein SH203_00012 [Brevundimonas sp. SH203]|uniref:DUF3817 domain-containing protein n=1 Tax=Brevundimonas sp. SH203 TaxID=345167 RepID=UPI0009D4247A|nr:DUF3817 domain-containing protein [Brevundimonas sp. SH203]GAW39637.1 hypothetical protein SH203_00012 [Brevundimonas sp. SH203]